MTKKQFKPYQLGQNYFDVDLPRKKRNNSDSITKLINSIPIL